MAGEMSISVAGAPQAYRPYLAGAADDDGLINGSDEARAAANSCLDAAPAEGCDGLLTFLEGNGYAVYHLKLTYLPEGTQVDTAEFDRVVKANIEKLKNGDGVRQAEAVSALDDMLMGDVSAELKGRMVDQLIKLLSYGKATVRWNAIYVLDTCAEVSLAPETYEKIATALLDLLADGNSDVRGAAVGALGELVVEFYMVGNGYTRGAIVSEKTAAKIVRALLRMRKDQSAGVRSAAVEQLGTIFGSDIGAELKQEIIKQANLDLKSESLVMRRQGSALLGQLAYSFNVAEWPTAVVDSLIKAYETKDEETRLNVIAALSHLAGNDGVSLVDKEKIAQVLMKELRAELEPDVDGAITIYKEVLEGLHYVAAQEIAPRLKEEMAGLLVDVLGSRNEAYEDVANDEYATYLVMDTLRLVVADVSDTMKAAMVPEVLSCLALTDAERRCQAFEILAIAAEADISTELKESMVEPAEEALTSKTGNEQAAAASLLRVLAASDIAVASKDKMVDVLLQALEKSNAFCVMDALAVLAGADIAVAQKEKMVDPILSRVGKQTAHEKPAVGRALIGLLKSNLALALKEKIMDTVITGVRENSSNSAGDQWFVWRNSLDALLAFARADLAPAQKEKIVDFAFEIIRNKNRDLDIYAPQLLAGVLQTEISPALQSKILENMAEVELGQVVREALKRFAASSAPATLKEKIALQVLEKLQSSDENLVEAAVDVLAGFAASDISSTTKEKMIDPLFDLCGRGYRGWRGQQSEFGAVDALAFLAASDISVGAKEKIFDLAAAALQSSRPEVKGDAAVLLWRLVKEEKFPLALKEKMVEPALANFSSSNADVQGASCVMLGILAAQEISSALKEKIVAPMLAIFSSLERRSYPLNSLADDAGSVLVILMEQDIPLAEKQQIADAMVVGVGSEDAYLRMRACAGLRALAKIALDPAVKAEMLKGVFALLGQPQDDARTKVAEVLVSFAASTVNVEWAEEIKNLLLGALVNDDPNVRAGAVEALGIWLVWGENISLTVKEQMLAPLLKALKDSVPKVRQNAAKALLALAKSEIALTSKEQMVVPLIEALKAGEAACPSVMAELLRLNISPDLKPQMVDALLGALQNGVIAVRVNAVDVLGQVASLDIAVSEKQKIIAPLLQALGDENRQVAEKAVEAGKAFIVAKLPVWAKEELLDGVFALFVNGQDNAQANAVALLERILFRWGVWRTDADEQQIIQNKIIEKTLRLLTAPLDPKDAGRTGRLLKRCVESDVAVSIKIKMIDPLLALLKNENASIKVMGIDVLGSLAEIEGIEAAQKESMLPDLIAALQDKESSVRLKATETLRALVKSNLSLDCKAQLVAPAIKALEDKDDSVREGAVRILQVLAELPINSKLKYSMVKPLFRCLKKEEYDWTTVSFAAKATLRSLAKSEIAPMISARIKRAVREESNTE